MHTTFKMCPKNVHKFCSVNSFFSLDESERELINKGVSCGQILQCLDGNLLRRLKGNCGEGDIFVDSCFWWKVLEYLQESHLRSSLEYPKMDTTLTTMKDKDPMEDSKYDIHLVSNIVNWIAYDWSRRSCNAAEILGKVGLGCLSVERLTKIVDHRFEGIPECKAVLDRLIALKSSQDSYQLKLSCPDLFCSRTMLVGQVAIKWEDRSCYLFTTVHEVHLRQAVC
ncbi:uncharacterized protein [Amphiura filiformis]|uniref:uncharacterized protein n=1 Tax=Amphiura filiformis TaxID=82378 RepID=UPI003B228372